MTTPTKWTKLNQYVKEIPVALHPSIQRIRNKRQRQRIIKQYKSCGVNAFYQVATYYQFQEQWGERVERKEATL